jgi:uroporphyrin-III C-methyltransferase
VDTLVILMGLTNLPEIVNKLLDHGRSPQRPVAVIHSGTTTDQETVFGTLADIVERRTLVEPPALIVVGKIVSLADKLQWFIPMSPIYPLYDLDGTREHARA